MRRSLMLLLGSTLLAACGPASAGAPSAAGVAAASPTPAAYPAAVLADRPAAYWRLREQSGTKMADASGNHHDGVYDAAAELGQAGGLPRDPGNAVLFGGHAGATVPASPALNFNSVTIELWLKKRSNAYYGIYAVQRECGGGHACFDLLNQATSGHLELRIISDTNPVLVSSKDLELGTWYYVAATYDGSTANLYINGTLDSTGPAPSAPLPSLGPWQIGRRIDGFFADAAIDEVALYPVALSADRISAHWHAAGY